jgi:hypothetical protein
MAKPFYPPKLQPGEPASLDYRGTAGGTGPPVVRRRPKLIAWIALALGAVIVWVILYCLYGLFIVFRMGISQN